MLSSQADGNVRRPICSAQKRSDPRRYRRLYYVIALITATIHATAADAQKMYWVDEYEGSIRRSDLDGGNMEVILAYPSGPIEPWGIALDLTTEKIYWTDYYAGAGDTGAVMRVNLDGSDVEELVSGLYAPTGLALDVEAGKMYWCDDEGVERANLDGTEVEVQSSDTCGGGIALDLDVGKIYWATAENVSRANLDGSDLEWNLLDRFLVSMPQEIALDFAAGKMYVADRSGRSLVRANLDGSNTEVFLDIGCAEAFGVALDPVAEELYWTSVAGPEEGGIFRVCTGGVDVEAPVPQGLEDVRAIALDLRRPVDPAVECALDLRDFAEFQNCLQLYPDFPPCPCCYYDFVPADRDIDYEDLVTFLAAFSGP